MSSIEPMKAPPPSGQVGASGKRPLRVLNPGSKATRRPFHRANPASSHGLVRARPRPATHGREWFTTLRPSGHRHTQLKARRSPIAGAWSSAVRLQRLIAYQAERLLLRIGTPRATRPPPGYCRAGVHHREPPRCPAIDRRRLSGADTPRRCRWWRRTGAVPCAAPPSDRTGAPRTAAGLAVRAVAQAVGPGTLRRKSVARHESAVSASLRTSAFGTPAMCSASARHAYGALRSIRERRWPVRSTTRGPIWQMGRSSTAKVEALAAWGASPPSGSSRTRCSLSC